MSADLSRMYENLGELATTATLPSPEEIRAKARQRRIHRVSAALSAVLALAVLTGTALWLIPRAQTAVPPNPDIGPPVSFQPFDPSAKPVIEIKTGFEFGYAISRPGRSYVMWLDAQQVERVVAIDTATGRRLWEPTELGRFGDTNGMMVSRDAILMLTEQRFVNDGDPAGSDRLIAVDPATGKVMWERDYGFNDTNRVLFDDVLVITWQEEGRTEALDLKTGRPRWTVNERVIPGGTNAWRTHEEFRLTGLLTGPQPPTDRRIALQLTDGRIQLRSVDTGELISERGGASIQAIPDSYPVPTVVDGKSYVVDQRGLVEVELTGDNPARTLHRPSGRVDAPILPCGQSLLCLLETGKGDSRFATDLVVIETGAGKELWRTPVGDSVREVSHSGSAIVVPGESATKVFDMNGRQLWSGGPGVAGWVDGGNLFIFHRNGISGHALATGETTVLGGQPGYCGWDATHLTCPGAQGVFVWRYR